MNTWSTRRRPTRSGSWLSPPTTAAPAKVEPFSRPSASTPTTWNPYWGNMFMRWISSWLPVPVPTISTRSVPIPLRRRRGCDWRNRERQRLPGDLGDLVEVIAVPVADDHRESHDRGIAHDQRQREPVGTAEDAGRRRLGGRRTRARRQGYALFQPYKPSAPPPACAP